MDIAKLENIHLFDIIEFRSNLIWCDSILFLYFLFLSLSLTFGGTSREIWIPSFTWLLCSWTWDKPRPHPCLDSITLITQNCWSYPTTIKVDLWARSGRRKIAFWRTRISAVAESSWKNESKQRCVAFVPIQKWKIWIRSPGKPNQRPIYKKEALLATPKWKEKAGWTPGLSHAYSRRTSSA